MISLFYRTKENFNVNPNDLVEFNRDYHIGEADVCFGNLSKTNIFIGENNSGKSRFLRYLFTNEFLGLDNSGINNLFEKLKKTTYDYYDIPSEDRSSPFDKFEKIYMKHGIIDARNSSGYDQFYSILKNKSKRIILNNKFYFPIIRGIKDYKTVICNKLKSFRNNASEIQNKDPINHFIDLIDLKDTGLQELDVYKDVINNEYFSENFDKNRIITGGELYNEIKMMLLGDENQRNIIYDYQKFLQNYFFDGDLIQITPNEQKRVLMLKIGEEQEREIYNWGDGIQQLIIMLYYLFKYKDDEGKMFFIEEPELYLHPGILRRFIEIINSSIFPNHQYFITTHSNIILDVSADNESNMSIYKFKKIKQPSKYKNKIFKIDEYSTGDISLLNELGVRNSSVFLSNCSIWVEGITDRLYLKHYLRLYYEKNKGQKLYRENIDYIFIEYGGNNLSHFNFDLSGDSYESINSRYINNKIFLIADNDNSTKNAKKRKRKDELKDRLGENFYELECREIENLITKDILIKVLIKENPKFEKGIIENQNKIRSYKLDYLGKYIDDKFLKFGIKSYSSHSGSIKNKVEFCHDVIDELNDFDQLSNEAKKLTIMVYNFIEQSNNI